MYYFGVEALLHCPITKSEDETYVQQIKYIILPHPALSVKY